MWSWLIPQTENLIEYFGAATSSCSTTSYPTLGSPGCANAIPDNPDNPAITPAEPSTPLAALFRNARRPTSSALISIPLSYLSCEQTNLNYGNRRSICHPAASFTNKNRSCIRPSPSCQNSIRSGRKTYPFQ